MWHRNSDIPTDPLWKSWNIEGTVPDCVCVWVCVGYFLPFFKKKKSSLSVNQFPVSLVQIHSNDGPTGEPLHTHKCAHQQERHPRQVWHMQERERGVRGVRGGGARLHMWAYVCKFHHLGHYLEEVLSPGRNVRLPGRHERGTGGCRWEGGQGRVGAGLICMQRARTT